MPSTVLTGGGLDLNDGVGYFLLGFDLGENIRDQVWLEPRGQAHAILAADDVKKSVVTITLRVKGSTVGNLQTRLEAVRNEFSVADNTITWGIGAGSRQIITRPTPLPAVPLTNSGSDVNLVNATINFLVPRWTFSVTRDPYYVGATREPVI